MKTHILLIVVFFGAQFCLGQNAITLRIDPSHASGAEVSQVFSEINYIPLETKKESVFGKIDQLEVTDKYIIILDYDTNSILVFLRNGQFHCRINGGAINKAISPLGISSFTINCAGKELSFKNITGKWMVYDFNGKKLREDVSVAGNHYIDFSDGTRIMDQVAAGTGKSTDTVFGLAWTKGNRQLTTAFQKITGNGIMSRSDLLGSLSSPFYRHCSDTTVFFTQPYDNTIYHVNSIEARPAYKIVLPLAISLPSDFTTNKAYNEQRFNFLIRRNPDVVYAIRNVYKIGNVLNMTLISGNVTKHGGGILYNLATGITLATNHIDTDQLNYNLSARFLSNPGIQFADDKHLFSSIAASELVSRLTLLSADSLDKMGSLGKYLKTAQHSDNPVLVQLTPKSNW